MNDKNITKELKDSEIIKALECCAASSFDSCTSCPFMQRCENDEQIAKYALDIIKRLNGKLDAVLEDAIRLLRICGNMRNVTPASITAT